jgi:hypothetical protein
VRTGLSREIDLHEPDQIAIIISWKCAMSAALVKPVLRDRSAGGAAVLGDGTQFCEG